MKRSVFILLALLLCSLPAAAGTLGIFGSSYSPDGTDTAEGVGLNLRFGGGNVSWQIRASLFEEVLTDAAPEVYSIEVVPWDLGFNYNFARGSRIEPYVGAGLTYAVFNFDSGTTTTVGLPNSAKVSNEAGFYAQVGADFQIGRNAAIFAEAVGRDLESEVQGDDAGLDLNQKLPMKGVAFHLGVAISW